MECPEVVEVEGLFFVMFVLSFVSIIGLYGKERGTCVKEKGPILR